MLHAITDVFNSISIFIGAVVLYYYPEYTQIDSYCTFVFAILVLIGSLPVLKRIGGIILE